MSNDMTRYGVTRRSFLKTTAAAAACALCGSTMTALATADADEGTSGIETYYCHCRGNCEGACRIKVSVKDGKVIETAMAEYPDPAYNRICGKGLTHVQTIYNPRRVKYPMRRVPGSARGAGEWERISWDEAFEYIATTWKRLIDEYGPHSIAFSAGTGNAGYGNRISNKLFAAIGTSQVHYCYDMAYNYGTENALGIGNGWNVNEGSYFHKTKCFVVWGANMSEAHPQYWHFLMESVRKGAKLIVIDPNYTITASKADIYVPIRPATDAALFMCLTNLTIENDRHDVERLKNLTVAPYLVKKSTGTYLRMSDIDPENWPQEGPLNAYGMPTELNPIVVCSETVGKNGAVTRTFDTEDVIDDPIIEGSFRVGGEEVSTAFTLLKERVSEWTLAKTAEVCDIPEDLIMQVWETIVENGPVHGFQGFGPDHYNYGHFAYFAAQTLWAVTGNLAKDGSSGGVGFPFDNRFRMLTYQINAPYMSSSGPVVTTNRIAETVLNQGIYGKDIPLKSLYLYSGNHLGNVSGRPLMEKAWEECELVIVADMIMTESCKYADLVLPCSHWFEQLDMFIAGSPFATLNEQAIEPLYESKCDYDILCGIGRAMGFTEEFNDTLEEFLAKHFDFGVGDLTWEQFKREKVADGRPKRNGIDVPPMTATGRFQFYRETVNPNVNIGQTVTEEDIAMERLPYWRPPLEAWNVDAGGWSKNELAAKYPLIYTTERSKLKVHTMFGYNSWNLELIPEPIVKLSAKDAADRGIATGDYVRLFNDRGYVVLKAVVNDGIRPGMVVVPKGWQEDQFKEGHYNDLTSTEMNPVCLNNNYFDALVQVEKA